MNHVELYESVPVHVWAVQLTEDTNVEALAAYVDQYTDHDAVLAPAYGASFVNVHSKGQWFPAFNAQVGDWLVMRTHANRAVVSNLSDADFRANYKRAS